MVKEKLTQYSASLGKDMNIMVYGHGGVPVLGFPTQDSMCQNYEDFGLIDHIGDFIENRLAQFFVVDTVDAESWSCKNGDPYGAPRGRSSISGTLRTRRCRSSVRETTVSRRSPA